MTSSPLQRLGAPAPGQPGHDLLCPPASDPRPTELAPPACASLELAPSNPRARPANLARPSACAKATAAQAERLSQELRRDVGHLRNEAGRPLQPAASARPAARRLVLGWSSGIPLATADPGHDPPPTVGDRAHPPLAQTSDSRACGRRPPAVP